ncbi:ExbD/TolR family protein [Aestuariibius insulae]|uniref:ExbD/TolR family protein n=1 Tax=Aestuariibius insulae TaxID=2058287 RepID=UPI00345E63AA
MASIIGSLPQSRRNYKFALTPLADAMFQLLIFFMLSSGLNPYSLLTVGSGAIGQAMLADTPGEIDPAAIIMPGSSAIWNVEQGAVRTGGERFDFAQLVELAEAAALTEASTIILIADEGAQVQDIATVLEALTVAGVGSIQLAHAAAPS